ncbi:MAG: flagellar protein FlgN [Synergistaceae bacterium]|nr:flagellar protein FlgN [Synergistaceae bacterium]
MQDDVLTRVTNLLARELGMYQTLRRMVGRELEAIVLNGDMEELLQILQEKQEVVSQLQLLSDTWVDALPAMGLGELRGTVGFWEKLAAFFSDEDAAAFEKKLMETRSAAEDLMKAEKNVQDELEKHVQQLRDKMLQMKQGRSAFIGYAKMGGGNLDLN